MAYSCPSSARDCACFRYRGPTAIVRAVEAESVSQVMETLPGEIEEIENVWIVMSDGCRIAARIWLPRGARTAPVPAILEYIPYRKRDFMRARDEPIHRY